MRFSQATPLENCLIVQCNKRLTVIRLIAFHHRAMRHRSFRSRSPRACATAVPATPGPAQGTERRGRGPHMRTRGSLHARCGRRGPAHAGGRRRGVERPSGAVQAGPQPAPRGAASRACWRAMGGGVPGTLAGNGRSVAGMLAGNGRSVAGACGPESPTLRHGGEAPRRRQVPGSRRSPQPGGFAVAAISRGADPGRTARRARPCRPCSAAPGPARRAGRGRSGGCAGRRRAAPRPRGRW